jgi:hypothetical protein
MTPVGSVMDVATTALAAALLLGDEYLVNRIFESPLERLEASRQSITWTLHAWHPSRGSSCSTGW